MKIPTLISGRRPTGIVVACLLALAASKAAAQFSGAFAPANFTLTNSNLTGTVGSVNTAGAPATISITSGDLGTGAGDTTWSRLAPSNGRVSFNWSFTTADAVAQWDPFGYVANGVFSKLTNDAVAAQSGTSVFSILSGQSLGFRAQTVDNQSGASTTVVSNFLFSNSVYWKGNTSAIWNAANWTLDAAGTVATAIPDAPMSVVFSATGGANKTTTLGQDFTILNLTVSDGSTVTIGGANALTVTGATTVSSGSLILPGIFSSPSHTISGGAALELNVATGSRDYAATAFAGTGTLRKTGAGNAAWGAAPATFALGSGALIDVQGGTFTGGSFDNEVWTTNLSDLNVAAGAFFDGVEANVRVDVLSGTGTIKSGWPGSGSVTYGLDNGSGTFGGVLADSNAPGSFVKAGTGTQTLSGTVANTYTGLTVLNNGTLNLGKTGGATAIVGAVQMGSGVAGNQPNLRMDANGQFGAGVVMTFVNPIGSFPRFDLQGTTQTLAGIVDATGAGVIQNERILGGGTSAAGALTLNGTGSYSFNGFLRDEDDGGHVFKLSLTKAGAGSQTLAGANVNYQGATTVNAGTLQLKDTNVFASAVTVNTGATLSSNRSVAGSGNRATILGSSITLAGGTLTIDNAAGLGGGWTSVNNTGVLTGSGAININSGVFSRDNTSIDNINTTGPVNVAAGAFFGAGRGGNSTIGALTGAGVVSTLWAGTSTGSITIGNGGGSGTFAGTLDGNGSNATDLTQQGGILSVIKVGTGTQTFTGANTYAGTTTLSGGILQVNSSAGLGNGSATNTLIFNGGTLRATGAIVSPAARGVTMTGSGTLDTNGNNVTFGGPATGAGVLIKAGTGTLTLTGPSSYNGGTTLIAGAITTAGAGLGTGTATVGAGTTLNAGGVSGLASLYYNTVPASANFASLTTLIGHLGALGAPNLVTNATTLNFQTNGSGFPAPYNSTTFSNFESYYSGVLNVTTAGTYTFNTSTDDGSMIWIDGGLVVNNNNFQPVTTQTGNIFLTAGEHTIGAAFYQGTGGYGMNAQISGPGNVIMEDIDTSMGNGLSVNSDLVLGGLSGAGFLVLQNGGLIVGTNNASSTFSGNIFASSAVAGLTKFGTGTLTLTGNNSYAGTTNIGGGSITTAGSGLGRGAVNLAAGTTLNVGGVAGLASLYYNTAPASANFNSLDVLGAHLGGLGAPNLLTNATTLNFQTNGSGFPPPYNAGGVNFESYYSGILNVTTAGTYRLNTSTDDGSMLWIDGALVVNNNSFQGVTMRFGDIFLNAGPHTIVAAFYQGGGGYGMNAQISGPGNTTMEDIDTSMANGLSVTSDLVVGSLNGAGNVSLQGGSLIVGTDNSSGTFTGSISASGAGAAVAGLNKFGTGTLTLGNVNTFNGRTTVNGGFLQLGHANAVQNSTLHPSINNAVRFNTGIVFFNVGGLEGPGNIALQDVSGGGYIELRVGANNASTSYSGILSGGATLSKLGTGTLTLSGASTYTAGTGIGAGILVANEPIAAGVSATGNGFVSVFGTGTLAGGNAAGTVGSVRGALTVDSGGKLSPGIAGAGILTVNGNTTFTSSGTLQLDITGTTLGTQYDQLTANGTVALGNATLVLAGSFVAAPGQEFVIVNNDGADAITGTFNGLPEAGTVTFNGVGLIISYVGGDGNDVTLRAPFVVTNALASGAGSLRQRLVDATPGGLITFDPSLGGKTIPAGGTELVINKSLNIDATALTAPVTISGGKTSRVFNIAAGNLVKLTALTITEGNSDGSDGGGIYNEADLTVRNSTLSHNYSTRYGGAIENRGTLTMRNCTVANNSAASDAGGIDNWQSVSLVLTNSTISGNTSGGSGGGIWSSQLLTLSNTLVAGNRAVTENDIYGGVTTNLGGNLIGDGSGVSGVTHGVNNDQVGTGSNPIDPRLAPLGNYGGLTQSMPPLVGSPAIDAGVAPILTTDQRGFPRVVDGKTPGGVGSAVVDIGAVEAGPVTLVTSSSNSGGGTLRNALSNATAPGARILFNLSSANSVITLTSGQLAVSANRTIFVDASSLVTAAGVVATEPDPIRPGSTFIPRGITVSGNNASRIFTNPSGCNLALYRVTVTGGNNPSGGACILNGGVLTMVDSTISNGQAGGGRGGAIYGSSATSEVYLRRCTLNGNDALEGGAVFTLGAVVLENCTLTGNTGGFGGAFQCLGSPSTIRSSTLSGNSAGNGGAIWNKLTTLTIENSIIAGNSSGNGADIFNNGAGLVYIGANLAQGVVSDVGSVVTGPAPINANPLLSPLANNGGPTQTMAFQGNSPAIDAGADSVCTPFTDQRGYSRILAGGLDIGAYETGAEMFNADGLTVYARVPAALAGSGVEIQISTDPNFLTVASTLAGTGAVGATDGASLAAAFSYPSGVARDTLGNIFVADTGNNRIRMLSPAGDVSTIAGTGAYGFADGPGSAAVFAFPAAVAIGPDNNLYVADTINHRIRKLTRPSVAGLPWTVTTIAGTGVSGFVEGPGTVARFSYPHGLVLDAAGNIFVADAFNNRVRQVTPARVVSTYAGSGVAGGTFVTVGGATFGATTSGETTVIISAPGVAPAPGMSITGPHIAPGSKILTVGVNSVTLDKPATGSGSGLLLALSEGGRTTAQFDVPIGVALDSHGNLFVADRDNHRIRMVTPGVDGVVTTFAGSGAAGFANNDIAINATFNKPVALAMDDDGNLYICDQMNNAIRKITPVGKVTTIAGTGAYGSNNGNSTVATFKAPTGLTVALDGNLLIADTESHTIRRVVIRPITVTAIAGAAGPSGVPFSAVLDAETLGLDPNVAYYFRWHSLADESTQMLGQSFSMIDFPSIITTAADNVTPTAARLNATVNPNGNSANVVFKYSTDPAMLSPIPVTASAGSFGGSGDLAVAATIPQPASPGDTVYFRAVASNARGTTEGAILSFTFPVPSVVTEAATNLTRTTARLNATVDPKGSSTTVKFQYSTDPGLLAPWAVTTFAGSGAAFNTPQSITLSGGNYYVADRLNHRIRKITPAGVVSVFAGSSAGIVNASGVAAKFDNPSGVAADASGNLYVADQYNHVIRIITSGGVVSTFAGSGVAGFADGTAAAARFLFPAGVAVYGGDLYVADSGNHSIRKVALVGGAVSTVAGTGVAGFTDTASGPAQFDAPLAVAVTADKIYVADSGNHRIRVIAVAGNTVTTLAGSGTEGFLDGSGAEASFASPSGIAVGGDGVAYVADRDNHRIRRVAVNGQVGTLAGSGVAGLADTLVPGLYPATATRFNLPSGIAIDVAGSLFVTQEGNPAVRKIARSALPQVTVTPDSTGTGPRLVSADIAPPLMAGATYYYRALATNTVGTVEGAIIPFTTPLNPGIAVSSGTGDEAVELSNGQASEFDFGTTPIGIPVTRQFTIGNTGGSDLSVSTIVVPAGYSVTGGTGTVPAAGSVTFGVTLSASAAGTFSGNVQVQSNDPAQATFAFPVTGTVLNPPGVVTLNVAGIPSGGAILNATVNPTGSSTSVSFEYSDDPELDGVQVTTMAGSTSGFADGAALTARFNQPYGMATDAAGNTYVADSQNHLIRKISPGGSVSTVAGTGVAGFADGPAATAQFNVPVGVVLGAAGTAAEGILFVSDSNNHRIRAISPSGEVTTFSGLGAAGFANGVSSGARFNTPRGLAIDASGDLYVADLSNLQIRKVALDGSVSTLAGSGASGDANGAGNVATFTSPEGVAVSTAGVVYIAETNHVIRQILPNGTVSTLAGLSGTAGSLNATGAAARFSAPTGIAVDAAGLIYVADRGNHRMRKITPGGVVTTLAGTGTSGNLDGIGEVAQFDGPVGVTVDAIGSVIVGQIGSSRIRRIAPSSIFVQAATGILVSGPVSAQIAGLEVGKTYYVRAIATNGGGTTYGSIVPFLSEQEIVVEQPAGTNIVDGGTRDFGSLVTGSNTSLSFTIRNIGNADLTGLVITKDGTNAGDFTVTVNPVAPVSGPGGSTNFTVRFAPSGTGPRTAAIHIANNDSDEGPFDITLTGTGTAPTVLPFQAWQTAQFGANAGNPLIAGPTANPGKDGVINVIKYALGMDPNITSRVGLPVMGLGGGALTLTYTKVLSSFDLVYVVEWSNNLATWSTAGVTETILSGNGTTQQIRASVSSTGTNAKFIRLRVTLQ